MPSFKAIELLVLEKKILKVFAVYSHGGYLGHVALTIYTNWFPLPKDAPYKVWSDWPRGFRGCERRRRTTEHGYTISSPCEPNGSGEPKRKERRKQKIELDHYFCLSYNVAVFQWITSCHKNRMNTRVITLLREYVT